MTEELIKLMLSVTGQDAVKDLQEQLGYTEATLNQLKGAFQRGEITTDEFLKVAKRLTDQEKQLQENIRLATEALAKQAMAADTAAEATTANVDAIGKSGMNSAYKMMQLGQTLDDLQYVGEMGLRPIINNVMQLDARMGIALIVVQSLINAFGEQLVEAVTGYAAEAEKAKTETEKLTEKIEQLEKKPRKLAIDFKDLEEAQDRLDKLKADESAYNSAKESSPEQQLASEAKSTATKYMGGADQLTAIVDAMEKQGGFKHGDPELYAKLDKFKYQLENPEFDAKTGVAKYDPETTRKNIAEVEAAIDRARKEYSKGQVAAFASGDPGAIKAMQNRVKRNPGAFNRKGADGLTGGEAILNLPSSVEDMFRRQEVDREITNTDDADKENMQGWRTIQQKRRRTAADEERHEAEEREMAEKRRKDIANREAIGLKEAEDLQRREKDKKDLEAKRSLEKSRAENKKLADEKLAEQRRLAEQAERDRLDPVATAERRLAQNARSGLRAQGWNRDVADIAAPKLAELVTKGMDVQSATMQALAEAQQQIMMANRALQQNLQMQALIQQQQRRARVMMPTTQPVPFAN